ncbi:hypothetical protein PybrP1_008511, partial [[Pythium] brassicae (nom. inval.)]
TSRTSAALGSGWPDDTHQPPRPRSSAPRLTITSTRESTSEQQDPPQTQLSMMVTPLPATRANGRQHPPADLAFASRAMSPIKKHLQNAASSHRTASSTTRTPTGTPASPSPRAASGATMGAQRAAIVQVMLALLSQDEETVQGTLPVLQALAALPLENLSTRRECLLQLQRLGQLSASPFKRVQPYDLQLLDRRMYPAQFARASEKRRSASEFDYASTAGSSGVSVATEVDQDDVEADQGSEFSEVLRRADYLSDVGSDGVGDDDDGTGSSAASWSMQVANERSFHSSASGGSARGPLRQLKRHAFDALRQNGRQKTSARRAFQRMKTHAQQMRLKRLAMAKLRLATWPRRTSAQNSNPNANATFASAAVLRRTKFVLSQHLDLVFVVLCAASVQALALWL